MSIDKTTEAAWDYHSDNYFADNPHREDIMDAFEAGAEWLMSQPLAERLTEEEKNMVRDMMHHAESFYKIDWENGNEDGQAAFWRGQIELLKTIFGTSLFNDKSE